MTTLFRGTTNGGANRVFEKNGDLLIGGQAVAGRKSLDADLIAKVWGGDLTQTATLKAGSSWNDINDATISLKPSGGLAAISQMLAEKGSYLGNFDPGQDGSRATTADVIGSKLTDPVEAISRASIRQDEDGNWEVSMSGTGINGRVSTNDNFATQDAAQAFIDSLMEEATNPSTWSVHVEDNDLDGSFVFEFSGWYRDVNAKKIEAKLADSDVVSDGEINSKAEGAAANLALFLEQMANASGEDRIFEALVDANAYNTGNFGPGQNGGREASAESLANSFNDLARGLEGASLRQDADLNWEVQFSGGGMGGRVWTNNDFASKEDAEEFLADLVGLQGGYLDDALF